MTDAQPSAVRRTCALSGQVQVGALIALIGLSIPLQSLARSMPRLAAPHITRAALGQPDLEGVWTNGSLTRLERRAGAPLTFATRAEEETFEAAAATRLAARSREGVGQGASEWLPDYRMARIDGKLRTSFIVDPPDGRIPYRPEARKLYQVVDDGGNFDGRSPAIRRNAA